MVIGVRKQKRTSMDGKEYEGIDFWEEAYRQTKIPHERLSQSPYNYIPVEVPDEYVRAINKNPIYDYGFMDNPNFLQDSDFNDDLTFSQEKHDARVLKSKLDDLRMKRNEICFPVINRGQWWFETLSIDKRVELKKWYQDWLDVTETQTIPPAPEWLNLPKEDNSVDLSQFFGI